MTHVFKLVSIIILLCMVSCKSKEYKQLENEIEILKLEIEKPITINKVTYQQRAKRNIAQKKIWDNTDDENILCGFNKLIARNYQKFGKVNETYNANCRLTFLDLSDFHETIYTLPVKEKHALKNAQYYNSNDQDFFFEPKDSGMYYWKGYLVVHHSQTGKKTEFPILDSIYVLP